ncbi:MAG: hypothetical protein M0027_18095 [Candidatus Dormibacteraeota bacterium]|nr:hypothetical protein [Candidatus Dormibacteraeota bacterium]
MSGEAIEASLSGDTVEPVVTFPADSGVPGEGCASQPRRSWEAKGGVRQGRSRAAPDLSVATGKLA